MGILYFSFVGIVNPEESGWLVITDDSQWFDWLRINFNFNFVDYFLKIRIQNFNKWLFDVENDWILAWICIKR